MARRSNEHQAALNEVEELKRRLEKAEDQLSKVRTERDVAKKGMVEARSARETIEAMLFLLMQEKHT